LASENGRDVFKRPTEVPSEGEGFTVQREGTYEVCARKEMEKSKRRTAKDKRISLDIHWGDWTMPDHVRGRSAILI